MRRHARLVDRPPGAVAPRARRPRPTAGWAWRIEEAVADRGVIGVHVDYPVPAAYTTVVRPATPTAPDAAGGPVVVPLFVRYPPTYPWFPPDVADLQNRLDLPRHRQPVAGTLCLVAGRDWRIGTTAAELLRDQMPRLLAAATATGPLPAAAEIPAPEPVGNTLAHHAGAPGAVDGALTVPPRAPQRGAAGRVHPAATTAASAPARSS